MKDGIADRRYSLLDSYENAAVIVSGIGAGELGHPTPCPGYDVAGLIDHLVEAGRRAAALGRGQAPPPGDESPRVALADAPSRLRSAAQEAAPAWGDEARLSATVLMPWGEEYTGDAVVDMYLAELATHAWDLAVATGQLGKLDRSLALPALDGARATIKPRYRDMVGPGAPFLLRRSPPLPMPTTGNASPPSWDATRGRTVDEGGLEAPGPGHCGATRSTGAGWGHAQTVPCARSPTAEPAGAPVVAWRTARLTGRPELWTATVRVPSWPW
jgi:uncharacterized protein (TIGR03086 family)